VRPPNPQIPDVRTTGRARNKLRKRSIMSCLGVVTWAFTQVFQTLSWQGSNRVFLGTFIGIVGSVYLFILLVDPYGVVPFSLPIDRALMSAQRQMYPQILRTGRYDSIVVGTSTSRLLDPVALDRVLGGHFASLAMPAATAAEQFQVIDYFRRTVKAPKAVLIGLDHEWCYRNGNAYIREHTATLEREFPAWAFDDSRWNDILHVLNVPTLQEASHVVGHLLGRIPEKLRDDGFEVFVPPDSAYDPGRAHFFLYDNTDARVPVPVHATSSLSEAERNAMDFEALPWLDEGLAGLPDATRKILMFPPLHAHAMLAAGPFGEARDGECKRLIIEIARRRGATLVDWRILSPLTTEDSNFWDPLHYRLPVAYRLIDDLGHIVNEGRESPDGSYRILVR
jgi:hypothetical protein